MKGLNVFHVLIVAIFAFAMYSCNKNDELTPKRGTKDPDSYYSVVKMKQDYSQNAFAIKTRTKVQPALYGNGFLPLKDGYWVTKIQKLDGREVPLDMSPEELKKLEDEYAGTNWDKLCDLLYTKVIDSEPFEEIYSIRIHLFAVRTYYGDEEHYSYDGPDIDKINALIESGEFFTHEGVEREK